MLISTEQRHNILKSHSNDLKLILRDNELKATKKQNTSVYQ